LNYLRRSKFHYRKAFRVPNKDEDDEIYYPAADMGESLATGGQEIARMGFDFMILVYSVVSDYLLY